MTENIYVTSKYLDTYNNCIHYKQIYVQRSWRFRPHLLFQKVIKSHVPLPTSIRLSLSSNDSTIFHLPVVQYNIPFKV